MDNMLKRTCQKGASSTNNSLNHISLFEGQTSFTLPLAELEAGTKTAVSLSAVYRSTSEDASSVSNICQPDSLLGQGWHMDLPRIELLYPNVCNTYDSAYYLVAEGGVHYLNRLNAQKERIAFFAEEFPFWKFYYYPDNPQSFWEIVKDDGSICQYGGTLDSICLQPEYDNWVGACSTGKGRPMPTAWYLSKSVSYGLGESTYSYVQDTVSICGVASTRNIRLSSIRSPHGAGAQLIYGKREAFEQPASHFSPNGKEAYCFLNNPYYLSEIQILYPDGTLHYRNSFLYCLMNLADEKNPSFTKRYLQKMRRIYGTGVSDPDMEFTYDFDKTSPHRGLLTEVSYPYGEKTAIEYTRTTLPGTQNSFCIKPPAPGYEARIWQGSSYTIAGFEQGTHSDIHIYSWHGTFEAWQDKTLQNLIPGCYEIIVFSEFFLIMAERPGKPGFTLYLYRQNPLRRHEWISSSFEQQDSRKNISLACGDDFVAMQSQSSSTLFIYQYTPLVQEWEKFSLNTALYNNLSLGAGRGCVFVAGYQSSIQTLNFCSFYRNSDRRWCFASQSCQRLLVNWELTSPKTVWSVGACQASAVFIREEDENYVAATQFLLRWDAAFVFRDIKSIALRQTKNTSNPILYGVMSDTVIGQAQNIFRYTPGSWNEKKLLSPHEGSSYRYAYGSDLALAARYEKGRQEFTALRYDVYNGRWTDEGTPRANPLSNTSEICQPAVSDEFALLGRQVFAKTPSDTWEEIFLLPSQTRPQSALFSKTGSYLIYELENKKECRILFFKNKKPGKEFCFTGQCFLDPEGKDLLLGGNILVTYEGDSLKKVKSIRLYHLQADSYKEHQSVRQVRKTAVHTGSQIQNTYFSYHPEGVSFQNGSPNYSVVDTIPISENKEYGYTRTLFYAGLSPQNPAACYPPDGEFSHSRKIYSLLCGQVFRTECYDSKETLLCRDTNEIQYLKNKSVHFAAEGRQTKEFFRPDLTTGAPASIVQHITHHYETMYGRKRSMTSSNVLSDGSIAQTTQEFLYGHEVYPDMLKENLLSFIVQTTVKDSKNTPLSAHVQTFRRFDGLYRPYQTYLWKQTGDAEFFKESCRSKNWQKNEEILSYTPWDEVVESTGAKGRISATQYDKNQQLPIAHFSSAALSEVVYAGFEDYECLRGVFWENAELTSEEFFSGTQCLRLSPGGSVTFSPDRAEGRYLFSCAAKAENLSSEELSLHLKYADGTEEIFPWENPAPQHWQSIRQILFTEAKVLSCLRVENRGNGCLLLDTCFLTPVDCEAQSFVYERSTRLTTAEHYNTKEGRRFFYDGHSRPVLEISDGETPLKSTHYGYAEDSPECFSAAVKYNGGTFLDFTRSNDSCQYISLEGNWLRDSRGLLGSGSISTEKPETLPYGIHLSIVGETFSIEIGSCHFSKDNSVWRCGASGESRTEAFPFREEITITVTRSGILFLADGKLLFTCKKEQKTPDRIKLNCPSTVLIRFLSTTQMPCPVFTFQDNTGRPLQEQMMTEDGLLVEEVLYHPGGQAAVQSKKAFFPGEFPGYRHGFITKFDWERSLMEGEVHDKNPQDEGRCFTRGFFSASPLMELSTIQLPGKDLETAPVRFSRFISQNQFISVMEEPDGQRHWTARDWKDHILREGLGPEPFQEQTRYEFNLLGQKTKIFHSGYFEGKTSLITEFLYDHMGNCVFKKNPDGATTAVVYDSMGLPRFYQDSAGKQSGYYIYLKYDSMGRQKETGTADGNFDTAILQAFADTGDFPAENCSPERKLSYNFCHPCGLGNIRQAETLYTDASSNVMETFLYDFRGNLAEKRIEFEGRQASLTFSYDDCRNLLLRQGKSFLGRTLPAVSYVYDTAGRMTGMSSDGRPIGRRSFNAFGATEREVYGNGDFSRILTYTSTQQLKTLEDPYFRQSFTYASSPDGKDYSGKIRSISTTLQGEGLPQNFPRTEAFSCSYDSYGRLVLAGDTQIRYDSNRTLHSVEGQGADLCYQYPQDSNRLLHITEKGQTRYFSYNENGTVTEVSSPQDSLHLFYSKTTGTPTGSDGGTFCHIFCEGAGYRIAKRFPEHTTYYLNDFQGNVIFEETEDSSSAYYFMDTQLWGMEQNKQLFQIIRDYQGSVRAVVQNGKILNAYTYRLYGGDARTFESTPCTLRYLARPLDKDVGLYFFTHRWYNAEIGCFYGQDPQAGPFSPYVYAGGDCINYIDITGNNPVGSVLSIFCGVALMIGGAIVIAASGGTAAPAVSVFYSIAGSFLVGAGISGTIYGITSAITGKFDVTACLLSAISGGVFGALTAGTASLVPQICTRISTKILSDAVLGGMLGMAEGVIDNGISNITEKRSFFDTPWASLGIGLAVGALFGGMSGLGTGWRNAQKLRSYRALDNPDYLIVGNRNNGSFLERLHSRMTLDLAGNSGRNTIRRELFQDENGIAFLFVRNGKTIENAKHTFGKIPISPDAAARIQTAYTNEQILGNYSLLTNNCTTFVARNMVLADIYPPAWAVVIPQFLTYYARYIT